MDKINKSAKFSMSFAMFGGSLVAGIITGYITYFGTDVLGVAAMALTTILLVSRVFDGVTDVLMGIIIDKTKSKYGKARPWIARAIIPATLFTVLLFAVPGNFSTTGQLIWLFVFYNLYALGATALNIALNTLTVRLTNNEKEINSLSTFIMFGMIFGNVFINAIAVVALTALSGGPEYTKGAFIKLTAILAIVNALGCLFTFLTTREMQDDSAGGEETTSTKAGLKSLFSNKYWIMQVLNSVFIYLGLNARLAAMIYYCTYVLGNPELVALLVLADNIPSLVCMPIALQISNKFGKRKTSLIGLCGTLIGFALMFLNIYNLPLFIAGLVVRGICFSPVQGSTNAFIADCALYGEWKTGVKTEGIAFSAISFAGRVSSGLASAVVGLVLTLTGYVAKAPTQTAMATNGIIFLYIGVTFICTIGQIIVFACYDLDNRMGEIRADMSRKGR